MNDIEKFRADARRAIKHERNDAGNNYDGISASKKVAEFFCRSTNLSELASSVSEYWLRDRIEISENLAEEPSSENIDWLAGVLSFLSGDVSECDCFTQSDWKKLGEFVNYEAEDMPIEDLSVLMGILLEKKAL